MNRLESFDDCRSHTEDSSTPTLTSVPGIKVGHAQDSVALTGCTVILTEAGAVCGVDVRGGAPGSRETDLLSPINMVQQVHAVCLTGGSAFGLDAATGVMRFLEEQGIGFNVGVGVVPIVPAAVLFDLGIGNASVRPDAAMGYKAAIAATDTPVAEGNVGAGCGATVGKVAGIGRAMKSGLGSYAIQLENGLVVGAVVAVNAVGEVRDPKSVEVIAGPRADDGQLMGSLDVMIRHASKQAARAKDDMPTNTVIGVVGCNASLNKAQATKVAQMAHDGLARSIYPAHLMGDGDTIFALATGGIDAPVDLIGALAADVFAEAITRGVRCAVSAGGLPSWSEVKQMRS